MTRRENLVFNAFEMAGVGYYAQGAWRHPRSNRHRYKDADFWVERAQQLEEGLFDAVFFADVLGVYDTYMGSPDPSIRGAVDFPLMDPLMVVAAMASATKELGFVVTASTTYEAPFSHARRFSTLDHLSKGRMGWNVVTSYLPNAAQNFGYEQMIPHEERYAKAEEFLDVVYSLWEGSWEDDATLYDKPSATYADPSKVHPINHAGSHFSVKGPSLVEPSTQRTPVIYQAGTSERGKRFAAQHAEAVFVNGNSRESLRKSVEEIRAGAASFGRSPEDIVILTDLSLVIGTSQSAAERKADEIRSVQIPEAALAAFSGASGHDVSKLLPAERLQAAGSEHSQSETKRFVGPDGRTQNISEIVDRLTNLSPYSPTLVGTPVDVANGIEEIVDSTGVDGFNLHEFVTPEDFSDFINLVVPILQKRGLYRESYEDGSLRKKLHRQGDRLPATHPASAFRRPR